MVNYSYITLGKAIDDIVLRIGKHRIPENMDWQMLAHFVNHAVYEVLATTLPYKDWAYIESVAVSNGSALPREYLKYVRCLLSNNGEKPYREARYVDVREYYTTTDWNRGQQWNIGSEKNPIYTIWTTGNVLTIYLYPNTLNLTGTAPTNTVYPTADMSGILEYYSMPPFAVLPTDILRIPYEYEEIVILSAMTRVYYKTGALQQIVETQTKIMKEKQKVIKLIMEKRDTEKRQLDSFIEPVVPMVDQKPLEGEFKEVLR